MLTGSSSHAFLIFEEPQSPHLMGLQASSQAYLDLIPKSLLHWENLPAWVPP